MFDNIFNKAKLEYSLQNDGDQAAEPDADPKKHLTAIDSRDAKLHHLYSVMTTSKRHMSHIDLN